MNRLLEILLLPFVSKFADAVCERLIGKIDSTEHDLMLELDTVFERLDALEFDVCQIKDSFRSAGQGSVVVPGEVVEVAGNRK